MSRRKRCEPIVGRPIPVIDHDRDARLLADPSAWERVGRELYVADPKRWLAMLKVAEEICCIHRDPIGPMVPFLDVEARN